MIVSIAMGSDSDLPVMQEAAKIMDEFDIRYEVRIISAHRTPEKLFEYATNADKRGIRIIIAGAGGAAHLPGMIASLSWLPVIGVPVLSKALHGLDSLLSIVQMPGAVPVSTMAINGAKNAGLTAVRMLAIEDKVIRGQLIDYIKELSEEVANKDTKLVQLGSEAYIKQM